MNNKTPSYFAIAACLTIFTSPAKFVMSAVDHLAQVSKSQIRGRVCQFNREHTRHEASTLCYASPDGISSRPLAARIILLVRLLISCVCLAIACSAWGDVVKLKTDGKAVSESEMKSVYDMVKTPYKYGIVIKGEEGKPVDCPNVFRYRGKWYMIYACMNKVGYETHLAVSENLILWKTLGKIMSFPKTGWDAWQADGSIALCDYAWGGSYELARHDGKYWMSYIGGALQGYETEPLSIGMAWTDNPTAVKEWNRIPGGPVLSIDQSDARDFEKATLYKSSIIWDKTKALGYPFVMYYNAKQKGDWVERIGMAVSEDLLHWKRYSSDSVVDNGSGISGDPQIARIGKLWVMFYFGAFWQPKAFDTFACSYDMVHWTKWNGPNLVEPSESWDKEYAHKPWVVKHNGVVYHFYCAVGDQGRVIALATSKDVKSK